MGVKSLAIKAGAFGPRSSLSHPLAPDAGVRAASCAMSASTGLTSSPNPIAESAPRPGVAGVCRWCLQYPPGFDSLRSPYRFEGPVRDAVHALKYRGVRAAADSLGALIAEYLNSNPAPADVLVPVPLHPRRLRSRGYNQSALLAREIGKALDLPVLEDHLKRTRNSRPQVEAESQQERRNNVAGSFECLADATGLTALLIDDVATTGSTLSECAHALKEAGATTVHALTLAREG